MYPPPDKPVLTEKQQERQRGMSGYIDPFWDENRAEKGDDELRLEQDILAPLSQSKRLFVYETKDFWRQIKSAGYNLPNFSLPSMLLFTSLFETLIG
jgi:hypothetical protein